MVQCRLCVFNAWLSKRLCSSALFTAEHADDVHRRCRLTVRLCAALYLFYLSHAVCPVCPDLMPSVPLRVRSRHRSLARDTAPVARGDTDRHADAGSQRLADFKQLHRADGDAVGLALLDRTD
jgi:hypothetical protein